MRSLHLPVPWPLGLSLALVLAACGTEPEGPQVLRQDGPATEPGPDPNDPTAQSPGEPPPEELPPEEPPPEEPPPEGPPPEEPPPEEPPPEEPPPEEPPDPLADCPRVRVDVAAGNTLNVRPTPSTAEAPIGVLGDGALVEVIEIVEGETVGGVSTWYEVPIGAQSGFVSGAYASCTLDEPPAFDGFYVPLACGVSVRIAQGNFGTFSHSGRSRYAYDFAIPLGTPMMAMAAGVVSAVYDDTGPGDACYNGGGESCFPYANWVELHHPDGSASIYKHLNRVDVTPGDEVYAGQQIGLSGSTGYSTGPHAHVMRQEQCGTATACESVPLVFVDVGGDGEPETDDWVTSGNCP